MDKRADYIYKLLSDWCSSLPEGMAVLEKEEHENYRVMKVLPRNQESCCLSVVVSKVGGMIVRVGENITYSDDDGEFPDDDQLLTGLLDSVYRGKVREKLWYRDDKIIKSEGIVEIEPKPLKKEYSVLRLPSFKRKRIVDKLYAPYQ